MLTNGDDYSSDDSAPGQLSLGTRVAGGVQFSGDKDRFKMYMEAGHMYLFTLDDGVTPRSSMQLRYVDENQVAVPTINTSVSGRLVSVFRPPHTATYSLDVSYAQLFNGPIGSYTLSSVSMFDDDYGNRVQGATAIALDKPIAGLSQANSEGDAFKIDLQAGVSYDLDFRPSGGDGSFGLTSQYVNVEDENGFLFTIDSKVSDHHAFTPTASGTYYLTAATQNLGLLPAGYSLLVTAPSTSDKDAPLLNDISTTAASGGVSLSSNIVLHFNEAMTTTGLGVVLKDAAGTVVPVKLINSVDTLTIDPVNNLTPGTSYTLSLTGDSVHDLPGNAFGGLGGYTFISRPAAASASAGDDLLLGTGTGLALNGGDGIDTVVYGLGFNSYVMDVAKDHISIRLAGGSVSDTLTGIERVLFADYAMAFDLAGNGGRAYLLYQAAFNRMPDDSGLGYWIAQMDRGVSLHDVAGAFVSSPEFKVQYGAAPDDAAFVDALYYNVLHRHGEDAGTAYWLQQLHDGASRTDVLTGFSESAENQTSLIVVGRGFFYTSTA